MSYEERSNCHPSRWSQMPRPAKFALAAAAGVVLIPAFLALFGGVTMWLWNWLMPTIFRLPTISFWQAIGILILSHILFKGNHFGKSGRRHWKKEKIRERMGEEAPQPR
ncbi:MAG: hypothetical protein ABSH39_08985 [Candidatus Acidiferrum sp.]